MPQVASFPADACWVEGQPVVIIDGSEAHGDSGKVLWQQADGIVIVELDNGCAWPVMSWEIKSPNANSEGSEPSAISTTK